MHLVAALDLLSTFVFALVGARVAADRRMDYGGIILIATIAAVAGGLLRDILCQVEPVLLHRETIGTSALLGSIMYVLLALTTMSTIYIAIVAGATVFAVRGLSIYFDLNLPKIIN